MENNRPALYFPYKELFIQVFHDKVYLVGGTVRDYLLFGRIRTDRDIDLVVIDSTYETIEAALAVYGKTNTVGKSFAVVKFAIEGKTFDISIPRKDVRKSPDIHSHRNFHIETGFHISLEEDLSRRDFTCNSIAMRLLDDLLFDPFDGAGAISARLISMTNPDSFTDDPLRILRAARFASVLDFSIDPDIYTRAALVNLQELSMERVCEELFRLLLESRRPSEGLLHYFRLSVLEKLFPELYALTLVIQDSRFHPECDEQGHHTVWAHTMITIDIAAELARKFELDEEKTLALLLASLLHDVGKTGTTRWEFKRGRMTLTSVLHDSEGVTLAENFLFRLKVETRRHFPLKVVILKLIQYHHRIFELYRNQEEISYRAVARAVKDMEGEDLLLVLLDVADRVSREENPLESPDLDEIALWFLKKKEEFQINQQAVQPLLQGRDLLKIGIPAGRFMGSYLKRMFELQLDGCFSDKEGGLEILKKILSEEKKGEDPSEGSNS